jgi:hypothetical protein
MVVFRLLICSFLFSCGSISRGATEDGVETLSRFWEYQSHEVKKAISAPLDVRYTPEQLAELSSDKKKAYSMILANSCSVSDVRDYEELYRYRCLNGPLYELFELSLREPMVLLFVKQQDYQIVIGYLDRYTGFLRSESERKDGMHIDISFREFLLEIKGYLVDTSSEP